MWQYNSNSLYHFGVKGMKWGVRRKRDTTSNSRKQEKAAKKAEKELAKRQKKFEENVNRNWYKSYNKAIVVDNENLRVINKKYEGVKFDDTFSTKKGQQYVKEINASWQKTYAKALIEDFGPDPVSEGTSWVENVPFMNMYVDAIKD